jgi:hypothetical protein
VAFTSKANLLRAGTATSCTGAPDWSRSARGRLLARLHFEIAPRPAASERLGYTTAATGAERARTTGAGTAALLRT